MIIEFLVSLCMEYGGFLQGGYPKPPEIITLGPFDLVLESHGDLRIQHFKEPACMGRICIILGYMCMLHLKG